MIKNHRVPSYFKFAYDKHVTIYNKYENSKRSINYSLFKGGIKRKIYAQYILPFSSSIVHNIILIFLRHI